MTDTRLDAPAVPTPWAALAGIIATVAIYAVAQGLTYPLLSFVLETQGQPSGMIGLSAAMTPLGFITSAPFIPVLVRRFGAGRSALACAAAGMITLALIGWTRDVWWWFPLRYLLGVVVNPLYVLSESWLIALVPAERRGRIMGFYTAVIAAGFAAGPLSLTLVGSEGWPPFLVGLGAFALSFACLVAVLPRLPDVHGGGEDASVLSFVRRHPLMLLTVVAAAGFEQSLLALLVVYGAAHGIAEALVSTVLTVFIAGNIVLQFPLGMIAERQGANRVIAGCALASALGCLALPFVFEGPLLWPMVFVWGAVGYGVYTMSLIELGERFSGQMLVAGNAAFAMVWGVGGIAVPPVAGFAMDTFGPNGLPLTLGCLWLALAVARLVKR